MPDLEREMAAGFASSVSRETQDRLALFAELLTCWNTTKRLTSKDDLTILVRRHICDSLMLAPLLLTSEQCADLGSGAGFPGLILAICTGRHFTLIEANARKAAFLREAARRTAAPVSIYSGRIETMAEAFDLITARAVAPLEQLLALVHPRVEAGGRCLFPKGRTHKAELLNAARSWHFDLISHASITDAGAVTLEIRNVRPRLHP